MRFPEALFYSFLIFVFVAFITYFFVSDTLGITIYWVCLVGVFVSAFFHRHGENNDLNKQEEKHNGI